MAREPQYQIYDTIAFRPEWLGDNGWMTEIKLGEPLTQLGLSKRVTHAQGFYRAKRDFKGERPDDYVMLRFEITPEEITQELPHNQMVILSRRGAYLYNGNMATRGELREIWHETVGGLGHFGYERMAHRTLVWNPNNIWADPPLNNGLFLMMLRRHWTELFKMLELNHEDEVSKSEGLKTLAKLEEAGFRGVRHGKSAPRWYYGKIDVHSPIGKLWMTVVGMRKDIQTFNNEVAVRGEQKRGGDTRTGLLRLTHSYVNHAADLLSTAIADADKETIA